MAFRTADLSVLAYANNFTLWHYRTEDDGGGIDYFDPAHAMLRAGDIILANFINDGGVKTVLLSILEAGDGKVRCGTVEH